MSISVTIEGESRAFAKLDADIKKWEERADKAVKRAGFTAQGVAKRHCPVGTPESTGIKGYHGGRLRQSIQVDNSVRFVSTTGTNVKYSIFVHNGTYKMKARPFLRKGYDAGAQQLKDEMRSGN